MDDLVERLLRWEERTYGPFGRQVRVSEETLTEAAARIQALETSLAEARRQAFEEAAKVARDCAIYDANDQLLNSDIRATCAQAIRALASDEVKP